MFQALEDWVTSSETPVSLVPPEVGLNFSQFVDALARCGLIGLSPPRIDDASDKAAQVRAEWHAVENKRSPLQFPAGRIQAIFTTFMGLLDSDKVHKRLAEV